MTEISIGGSTVYDSSGWLVDPDTTTVNVATIDFLARGGDGYDFAEPPFVTVVVTYELAVLNYLSGPLGGAITQTDYPNVTVTASSRTAEPETHRSVRVCVDRVLVDPHGADFTTTLPGKPGDPR